MIRRLEKRCVKSVA